LYFSLGRCHYTTALDFREPAVVVLSNIYNEYECDNLGLTYVRLKTDRTLSVKSSTRNLYRFAKFYCKRYGKS